MKNEKQQDRIESELTLLGMVTIQSRDEISPQRNVMKCRDAGINVVMITDKPKSVAQQIALQANIIQPSESEPHPDIFTGEEFFTNLSKA